MGIRTSSAPKCQHHRHLPRFFILGPPRTGTTWLHRVLSPHANLPSPTKETRFFDQHFHRGLNWYLAHFPVLRQNQIRGEVAPTYFASFHARERIARTVPSAKVICIFRNPLERVLSLYRVKRAYGISRWSFDQALVNDPELIESGRYATHLKAWQNALGKDQVLPAVFEDLRREPQRFLDAITDFIGLSRITLLSPQLEAVHDSEALTHPRSYFLTRIASVLADWFKAERLDRVVELSKRKTLLKLLLRGGPRFENVSPELAGRIYELFRPEIDELEVMLKRDLPMWKGLEASRLQAA